MSARKLNLKIEQLNNLGVGIATHQNKKVFIPYTLPGEEVSANILQENKQFIRAELDAIIKPSLDRINPSCKHFAKCGGCKLQHLEETSYKNFKRNLLLQALQSANLSENILDPIIIGPHSRRRINLKVKKLHKKILLGFHQEHSHNIVEIEECPVTENSITNIFQPLRLLLSNLSFDSTNNLSDLIITACDNGIDILFIAKSSLDMNDFEEIAKFADKHDIARINWDNNGDIMPVICRRTPVIRFLENEVSLPARHFLQATSSAQQIITKLILAEITPGDKVIDLYAGLGNYSFPISNITKVHAVEGNREMIKSINYHKERSQQPITTELRDLFDSPILAKNLNNYDIAVINPPRNGAEPQVKQICLSSLSTVIMVSCNPQSFSRDASILQKSGFKLKAATPIDQFYWSSHLELLAIFKK